MHTPVVSVVMPVYNGAEYLRQAMDSVLSQTLTRLELIAIDDGSTDDSGAILDWYAGTDDRVRVFHQDNCGVASSLNKGLSESRGNYIARMDSDDICAANRLAKQVALMENRPEIGVCGTGWRYIGQRRGAVVPATDDRDIRAGQVFCPCIAHPTAMTRRDLVVEHDLYYNTDFKQAEDYEYWLSFSRYCQMANVSEPLLSYRITDGQATSRHESDVHKWASLAHRQAISRLGIDPTEDELALHGTLAGATVINCGSWIADCGLREAVSLAEGWLLKLAVANESKRVYDADALRRVFFKRWYSFCSRAAESGTWAWPEFRKSGLCYGFRIPARCAVSFVVRYALRDRARRTYYRLSKFDFVWRGLRSPGEAS